MNDYWTNAFDQIETGLTLVENGGDNWPGLQQAIGAVVQAITSHHADQNVGWVRTAGKHFTDAQRHAEAHNAAAVRESINLALVEMSLG